METTFFKGPVNQPDTMVPEYEIQVVISKPLLDFAERIVMGNPTTSWLAETALKMFPADDHPKLKHLLLSLVVSDERMRIEYCKKYPDDEHVFNMLGFASTICSTLGIEKSPFSTD